MLTKMQEAIQAAAYKTAPKFPLHWPPHRNRGTPQSPKHRLSRSCIPQRLGRRLTTLEFFWRSDIFGGKCEAAMAARLAQYDDLAKLAQ